jgi:hypothetical protein
LVTKLSKKLEDKAIEKGRLEGEVRRAKMQISDRMLMLEESEAEAAKLLAEESSLKVVMEAKRSLLASTKDSETLRAVLESDEVTCSELAFSQQTIERGVCLLRKIVSQCKDIILGAESRLVESTQRYGLLELRVSSMGSILGSKVEQLRRMTEGGRQALFLRPVSNNPETHISTVHTFNTCPVCGFWYICYNFVPLGCGHKYYQFCLSEYAKK